MLSAGRVVSSNGCVTKPKGRETGCKVALCKSKALRSLAAMSWKWPNNGSRMNREVHVRLWESPEVKVLRATRQSATPQHVRAGDSFHRKRPWRPIARLTGRGP